VGKRSSKQIQQPQQNLYCKSITMWSRQAFSRLSSSSKPSRLQSCIASSVSHLTKVSNVVHPRSFRGLMSSSAITTQLSVFPEYNQAIEQQQQGNLGKAIPLLLRIQEVLDAYSSNSPVSFAVANSIATLYRTNGQFAKATQMLDGIARDAQCSLEKKVQCYQHIAICHLQQGDFQSAHDAAQRAVDILEQGDEATDNTAQSLDSNGVTVDPHLALFSPAYGTLGTRLHSVSPA
jgi:tetratricopeptide (TPR) repeat protein